MFCDYLKLFRNYLCEMLRLKHIKDCIYRKSSWFRPSVNNKYDWEDIKKIIASDPLEHDPVFLEIKILNNNYLLPIFFWTIIAIITILLFFNKELNGLALIAGIVSFFNATNLIIAKVRSENRQKWIDDVRSSLAEAITYIYLFDPDYNKDWLANLTASEKNDEEKRVREEQKKAEMVRIKLELLMNPSEKDHRTIGYLLRKAYGINKMERIDKPIEENLKELLDKIINMDTPNDGICKIDRDGRNLLISWLIRLSNATLKREWELVKNAK